MEITIRKIETIPFEINREKDEILATGVTVDNKKEVLEELGYGKAKETQVEGVVVYYKSRRNGVYLAVESF